MAAEAAGKTREITVGDTVRWSGYALESDRMYYLGLGDYTRKMRAKDAYDRKVALRGTVEAIAPAFFTVRWSDGTVSQSAPYRVEKA